jgi:tetratricopeptide (TPR) repeat protein
MTASASAFRDRFEALLSNGRHDFEADRLDSSLQIFEEAQRLAKTEGDHVAQDRAFVNICAVRMTLLRLDGLSGEMFNRLREILLAGEDEVNCRLAAYNLARAYEFKKEIRKGLFYARIARDRSRELGHEDWLASSLNQLANLLLAESRFDDACADYREALALMPTAPARRRALVEDNLGYAYVMLGRNEEGLGLLYGALRTLRRLGARRDSMVPHLDLAFTLLEIGRYRLAARHAAQALALAEELGEQDSIKNALFLLGEAANLAGDSDTALDLFSRLEQRYFPGATHLAECLLTVNVRKLINLRA